MFSFRAFLYFWGILFWEAYVRITRKLTKKKGFSPSPPFPVPPETGNVLLTGGTKGIGKETTKLLAKLGYKVIFTARDIKRGEEVLREVKEFSGNSRVECLYLDMEKLSSVRDLAKKLKERNLQIHLLINNAGSEFRERKLTNSGMERTFQVNYAGSFLLTNLLWEEKLLQGGKEPCRVINVSSVMAYVGEVDPSNIFKKPLTPSGAYPDSKLALCLFSKELQKRFDQKGKEEEKGEALSLSLHPGSLATDVFKGPLLRFVSRNFFASPIEGARDILFLCLSPSKDLKKGGFYCLNKVIPEPEGLEDEKKRKDLWEVTSGLVDLK